MRTALLALSLALIAGAAQAAPAPTLCQANEQPLFGCKHAKKIYALCASKDVSATTGYLQYRVSGAGEPFAYPATLQPPKGLFTYALLPKGGQLTFHNDGYSYELYSDAQGSMVHVLRDKDEQSMARFSCDDTFDVDLTLNPVMDVIDKMGLREQPGQ